MSGFKDLVAIVTGGGSGIGKALCTQLAAAGARVAVADLDADAAAAVAVELGGEARPYACDVADRGQVASLAADVIRDFGTVNLAFAHAGIAVPGRIMDTSPAEFEWLFDVNVGGVFHAMQLFVPLLLEASDRGERAHFVVTGSENALGVPLTAPSSVYTATKQAAYALADTLRRDLAETQVKVSVFNPGVTATRIWDSRRARQDRYGGASDMPADFAERASKAMQTLGQDPALTAAITLEGVARGDFLIVNDSRIRAIAETRIRAVEAALDACDARLAQEKS
jgi:NAD(P)-dependent dehydrogenase (short-subunit alcohol dehydrogenase family)